MRTSMLAVVIGSLFALSGCGETKVPVTGSVTKGGKPFTPADGATINVAIKQDDGTGSGTGTVGADGNFTIAGTDGGIPAGKYTVTVVMYPPAPAEGAKAPKSPPMPKTLTGGEKWDVSSSNNKFTIDLGKYK